MNESSVGPVNGAGAAYDTYSSSVNQENPSSHKTPSNVPRQSFSNNPRVPLSNLPAGRTDPAEHGWTAQRQTHQRVEDMGAVKAKSKNILEVGSHHNYQDRNGSNGNLSNAGSEDIPENMYRPEREEADGWIHREKLAKIENEELQAAGINLAKARTRSRDILRSNSRDRLRTDFATTEGGAREEKARNVSSPLPTIRREEDEETVEKEQWDLRSPEEIAAERTSPQNYATPVLRKSGSKIPVLSPNSHSTSPESLEGTTSVQRKRTISDSFSAEDDLVSSKLRTTSPIRNEDVGDAILISTKKSSPKKVREKSISTSVPSLSQKSGVPRKTSTSKQNPVSSNGRPRTRGNDSERLRTSTNAPEGDPPWLADMYKPDPRLPPDQQLIPTLAKKQRQMQWEEDGMVPRTYDKEFSALAVHGNNRNSLIMHPESEVLDGKSEEPESWPLKPLPGVPSARETVSKSVASSPFPATGGYSTMPKVSSPPMSIASPKIGPTSANVGSPNPNVAVVRQNSTPQQPQPQQQPQQQQQTQRPQQRPQLDDDDEKLQKKGCGCCIVM